MSLSDVFSRYPKARATFNSYCALTTPALPADPISEHQVRLHRDIGWSNATGAIGSTIEACGSIIEFTHRDHDLATRDPDIMRPIVAGLVATAVEGLMKICTHYRLDFGELCKSETP